MSREINKNGRIIKSLIAFTIPIGVSLMGFLVLYNNSDWGRLILVLALGFNVFILSVSKKLPLNTATSNSVNLGSICVISVTASFLLLEAAFPLILPVDYAQTRRFVIGPQGEMLHNNFKPDLIFDESEKISPKSELQRSLFLENLAWHKPGRSYVHLGYEPNQNLRYLNRVKWNETGYFDRNYSVIKPADVYRVVLIGDSYVESVQVPLGATFHKLAEDAANKSGFTFNDKRYEIIALGN